MAEIYSVTDKYNYLNIYARNDGDLALLTERVNPDDIDDSVFMHKVATLRTLSGGGMYTDFRLFEGKKGLYGAVVNILKDASTLFKENKAGMYLVMSNTAEIYGFPSDDDGGCSFHVLNCADIIGVKVLQPRQESVSVWLGDSQNNEVLKNLWQAAKDTYEHYMLYSTDNRFSYEKNHAVFPAKAGLCNIIQRKAP